MNQAVLDRGSTQIYQLSVQCITVRVSRRLQLSVIEYTSSSRQQWIGSNTKRQKQMRLGIIPPKTSFEYMFHALAANIISSNSFNYGKRLGVCKTRHKRQAGE